MRFRDVPKVELHLHLEGAIPLQTLLQLIRKYGGDPEVPDLASLERRFRYRDFVHFLETWTWKNRFLREYEDFRVIAEAVARDLAAQRVLYAEAFFSPSDFRRAGLAPQAIAEALRAGLDRVPDVHVALIADVVRNHGAENAERVTREMAEVRELGVIGIGLGGYEASDPPELFTEVYALARELGLRTTAHAGEGAGPESIWGAIRALRVDRIGHGTRAFEDPALVDHLAEHGIPVEACPISNVRTAVVKQIADHPIRAYFERGLVVTVNTDDPKMFETSLAGEYQMLVDSLGFTPPEIRTLVENAALASWLPEDERVALRDRIRADPSWG